jgi:hypothetical protein
MKQPDPEKTVFVFLQRLRGQGTVWAWGFSYALPAGWRIYVYPPPVISLVATVQPVTGDQDLFLMSIFGLPLGRPAFGGISPDTVLYRGPALGFLTISFFGFAAGGGAFSMVGVS